MCSWIFLLFVVVYLVCSACGESSGNSGNLEEQLRVLSKQVTTLLNRRREDLASIEDNMRRKLLASPELIDAREEMTKIRQEMAEFRSKNFHHPPPDASLSSSTEQQQQQIYNTRQEKNDHLTVKWLSNAIAELKIELSEVQNAVNSTVILQNHEQVDTELSLLKSDVSNLNRELELARQKNTKYESDLLLMREELSSLKDHCRATAVMCGKTKNQLKAVQLEWSHNWQVLNEKTVVTTDLGEPSMLHQSRHQRLLKKHILDLEKTSKSLCHEQEYLKTSLLQVEEGLRLVQNYIETKELDAGAAGAAAVASDEIYDRINGNEIQDYIKLNKIKEIGNGNNKNLQETLYNLTKQQSFNEESIMNLTKQMSNFDRLHMSMLELLENVESIENKIDVSFPQFRKEISKLEIQVSDTTSQISLLREDQTNTRKSVKAIGFSVSNIQDKTDFDRTRLKKIEKDIEGLKKFSSVQTSKLHDHILKLPDPEIAAPANDSLPAASEMTTPETSETTPAILGTGTTPETPGTTQQTSETKPSSGASFGPESNLSEISKLEPDIGLWPEIMTPSNIDYCIKMGASVFQNCDKDMFEENSVKQIDGPSSKTFTRTCQTSFFVRIKRNEERVKRSWLCFSPGNGRVFCYVCKLFSLTQSQFTDGGFCDWKNAKGRLSDHETSKSHLNATIHFAARSREIGRIDQELIRQAEEEASYWREIVKRLISVIMFISERGLAFRGENETLGSPKNGNYLGILELIAEYDSFLAKHIQSLANRGRGHSNYLSSTICEEIVEILGKQVFDEIISRIKQSKYFSVSLDSTPDEAHIDQLTLIFRYLEGHNPVERFVKFMPNKGHKAKDMFNALKNFLDENGLDIKDCRGQSYDNASSMSGKYNGLQALVLADNILAIWVPCAAHSLNLVVQDAAKSCLSAVSFFDFLEELYVYFTGSTNRYKVLTDTLKKAQTDKSILVPQRTTTTRWSCRADATKALVAGYKEIKSALFEIAEDKEDSGKSRITALSLHNQMAKIEVGILAVFWNDILGQVNKVSETLQNPRLDVNTAASALSSLKSLIASKRDSFKEYELKAAELIGSNDYEGETQRKRKINVRLVPLGSDQGKPVDLTPSEKFRTQTFIPIVDQFEFSLEKRLQSYRLVDDRFGVLRKMDSLTDEEITVAAKTLVETYDNDLDDQLANELIQFKSFYQDFQKDEEYKKAKISKERWMYELLIEKNLEDCFPNVEVTLRMYLSLMITNSSGERSFSKLKLIKNRLRTSMLEERLNYLALMSIECDILRKLNYDNVIEEFVYLKSRRKPFNTSTRTNK